MTSQPDKLFREHLEHFRKPAPDTAWDKINAGLERKQRNYAWQKVAASIVVILALTFLFWIKDIAVQTAVTDHISILPQAIESPPAIAADLTRPFVPAESKEQHQKISKQKMVAPTPQMEEVQTAQTMHSVEMEPAVTIVSNAVKVVVVPDPEPASEEQMAVASPTRTTIFYSSEEVNAKYLKKETIAEATPEPKKTSGIQKLIDIAEGLKYEDPVIGDLRQKKIELLSLNFLDSKQDINK